LNVALAAVRTMGAFVVGLVLGISSIQVAGMIRPDAPGLLVPIIVYAVIGGAVVTVLPPVAGLFLVLGWAAPWLLVGVVVITDDFAPWAPFPVGVTLIYLLALGIAWYRTAQRRQVNSSV
jgi:hypothetical protein